MAQENDSIIRLKVLTNAGNVVYAVPLDNIIDDVLTVDNLKNKLKAKEPITLVQSGDATENGPWLEIGFNSDTLVDLNDSIKASKTEVIAGDNITVTSSIGENGQTVYEITGLNVPNTVKVTSDDGSVQVNESNIGNVTTYDLSVDADAFSAEYAKVKKTAVGTYTSIEGDIEVTSTSIVVEEGQTYHITVNAEVSATTSDQVLNTILQFNGANTEIYGCYTDLSYPDTMKRMSFNGLWTADASSLDITIIDTASSSLVSTNNMFIDIYRITGLTEGEGSSVSDGKVAVNSSSGAGYLEDVLVSDSDLVNLVVSNGQMRVNVNTDISSDPKLDTCDEAIINGATSNYGSYSLNEGYSAIEWDDTSFKSYAWCNAIVYQMMRIASSQGTVTKCNLALAGTLGVSNPPACFNVGVFSEDGALLGQTGLKLLGTDFSSNEELLTVDMKEETLGSLSLDRNKRYIVQLWSIGLQFAGYSKGTTSNYVYDYTLRQNLTTTASTPSFISASNEYMNQATTIPYLSFGATSLN